MHCHSIIPPCFFFKKKKKKNKNKVLDTPTSHQEEVVEWTHSAGRIFFGTPVKKNLEPSASQMVSDVIVARVVTS